MMAHPACSENNPCCPPVEVDRALAQAARLFQQTGAMIPVPVERLCAELHITLAPRPHAPPGFRALLLYVGEQAIIIVNASLPVARQRYAVAHEIGHYLFDQQRLPAQGVRVERLCQLFAAHLLMPASAVRRATRQRYGRHDLLAQLAARFGVSQAAMRIQLRALRLTGMRHHHQQEATYRHHCHAQRRFRQLPPVNDAAACLHCPLQHGCAVRR